MLKIEVTKLHTLTGHRDCVYTLEGSGDDNLFFSGAGDGMVVAWNLSNPENGELIAKLPNSVYALHHHKLSNLLVAGHNFDGIHVLDWQNKSEVGSLQLTTASIFDLQSHNDDLFVATGDGTVMKVALRSLSILAKNQSSEKSARTIAIHPHNGDVVIGYSDNFIRVFDTNLQLKHAWQAHANSVFTIRFTPDGHFLMSGSRDARLKVWDVKAHYSQAAEVVAHMYAINHLDFSPDNKHFVTCSMDKSLKVWKLDELKLLKVIDRSRHAGHGTSVNKVLWTRHDDQLVSASDDRTISVWKIIF
ncbi:WD40 repeat domain-containing protein [Ohtaekwangia sp.]|uniref:WD40 repeat domain-containing protein n=1 Tax=Ohtaekwangia sp. TaxID=2066019 RepID=UPI002FDD8CFF